MMWEGERRQKVKGRMGGPEENLISLLAMLAWSKMREYSQGSLNPGRSSHREDHGMVHWKYFVTILPLGDCGKLRESGVLDGQGFWLTAGNQGGCWRRKTKCLKGWEQVKHWGPSHHPDAHGLTAKSHWVSLLPARSCGFVGQSLAGCSLRFLPPCLSHQDGPSSWKL